MTSDVSISLQGAFSRSKASWQTIQNEAQRDCSKALRIDFLCAANAESKCACIDAAKCASYFCKLAGIALEIVDRQITNRWRAGFGPAHPD